MGRKWNLLFGGFDCSGIFLVDTERRGGFMSFECWPMCIWGGLSIGVVYNGDAPGDTVSLKETQLQGQNKKRAEALFVVSYRVVL